LLWTSLTFDLTHYSFRRTSIQLCFSGQFCILWGKKLQKFTSSHETCLSRQLHKRSSTMHFRLLLTGPNLCHKHSEWSSICSGCKFSPFGSPLQKKTLWAQLLLQKTIFASFMFFYTVFTGMSSSCTGRSREQAVAAGAPVQPKPYPDVKHAAVFSSCLQFPLGWALRSCKGRIQFVT